MICVREQQIRSNISTNGGATSNVLGQYALLYKTWGKVKGCSDGEDNVAMTE